MMNGSFYPVMNGSFYPVMNVKRGNWNPVYWHAKMSKMSGHAKMFGDRKD